MRMTSILVFALFCIGFSSCFPQNYPLIGLRFTSTQRRERETDPLIGIRNWEEGDSSELIAISPAMHRKAVLPSHGDRPTIGRSHIRTAGFCADNMDYFESHCQGMFIDRDEEIQKALFKFCPWFENKCLHSQK